MLIHSDKIMEAVESIERILFEMMNEAENETKTMKYMQNLTEIV